MAQEWTDGRLDELSDKVDNGFDRVDRRLESVERRFEGVERRFEKVDTDIAAVRADLKALDGKLTERLDSIQRTMMQMMVALTAAILAGFAGICTLIAATL